MSTKKMYIFHEFKHIYNDVNIILVNIFLNNTFFFYNLSIFSVILFMHISNIFNVTESYKFTYLIIVTPTYYIYNKTPVLHESNKMMNLVMYHRVNNFSL